MAITPLPTPPTRQDPVNFADRADTFLAALPTFATEVNADLGVISDNFEDVQIVSDNIANINAAVADLPALSAKVSKTGDTMVGPLSVPAGASGNQVPRRSEVVGVTGNESVGGVKTFTSKPKVPAGATGDEVPQAQETYGPKNGQLAGMRNKIINGSGEINQRALTSVADDTYFIDRFYVLTESGNVNWVQVADPEPGAPFGFRLTQPDATAKRIGFATIIESRNVRQYASQAMNFFARVKLSAGTGIRYAIIEHTGTADVVTSDVVNNWASTTFTPSNFFIAGINILKTDVVTPGAATFGDIDDWAALGASVKNVILFVWSESTLAQNGTLEANRIQYEPGVVATPFEWRMNELQLCLRYCYQKSGVGVYGIAQVLGTSTAYMFIDFPVKMFGPPALQVSSLNVSSAVGSGITATSAVITNATSDAANINLGTGGGLVAGDASLVSGPISGSFLRFTAEL